MTANLNHPEIFKTGTRVLHLMGRNKDNPETRRKVTLVSHDPEKFDKNLEQLCEMMRKGERIYGTAEARDVTKASWLFRRKQLEADISGDASFYMSIEARWHSALCKPESRADKLFMFDCDSPNDWYLVKLCIEKKGLKLVHDYATPNGHHALVMPFKLTGITVENMIHRNPMMLWAHDV